MPPLAAAQISGSGSSEKILKLLFPAGSFKKIHYALCENQFGCVFTR